MIENLAHPCVKGVDAELRDALELLMRDEALRMCKHCLVGLHDSEHCRAADCC